MLQGIDHAQYFVHIAAQRQVVDYVMADVAFLVDQEKAAVSHGRTGADRIAIVVVIVVGGEHAVIFRDRFRQVGNNREGYPVDTAFVLIGLQPCEVRKFGIHRTADYGYIALFEFGQLFLEGMQLGRADECEVERIEEQHDVLVAYVLVE